MASSISMLLCSNLGSALSGSFAPFSGAANFSLYVERDIIIDYKAIKLSDSSVFPTFKF